MTPENYPEASVHRISCFETGSSLKSKSHNAPNAEIKKAVESTGVHPIFSRSAGCRQPAVSPIVNRLAWKFQCLQNYRKICKVAGDASQLTESDKVYDKGDGIRQVTFPSERALFRPP